MVLISFFATKIQKDYGWNLVENYPAVRGEYMIKFKFGNENIIFDDDFEFYNDYWKRIRDIAKEAEYGFEQKLDKINSIGTLIDSVDSIAQIQIDAAIEKAIGMLLENGIIDYDIIRFKDRAGDSVIFSCQETTQLLKKSYQKLKNAELEYQRQKEIERANRSRWEGGGFGVKGAIKGAVTAGAMNAVTNGVRSVGDSITDRSDASKYRNARNNLLNFENLEGLKSDFWYCVMNGIRVTFAKILEKNTGKNARYILWKGEARAKAIYNNIDKMQDVEQKAQALKEIIELNPYKWEYIKYVLDNCESIGVSQREIQEIARYVDEPSFLQHCLMKYQEKRNDIIKEYDAEYRYVKLKKLAMKYGFIDAEFNLIEQKYNIGVQEPQKAVLYLAWLKIQTRYGNTKNILEIDSYFALLEIEKNIVEILDAHKIIEKNQSSYKLKSTFENISSTTYGEEIIELISGLPVRIENLHLVARTVRNIVFDSIDEAEIFKIEIEKYEEIYLEGQSYADYESKCLEETLRKLKEQNFKSAYLKEKILELEGRLSKLKEHEISENIHRRQRIIDAFTNVIDKNLYLYRKNTEFLKEAYRAKSTEVMNQSKDEYPIVIYDIQPETDGISGFVLSESALYNYTAFWGNRMVEFENIQNIAYNEEKRLLLISTITGKSQKLKISSASKVREIAMAFSLAILDKEASIFETQGIAKQAQNLLNNGKNIFNTWLNRGVSKNAGQTDKTKHCSKCGFLVHVEDKFCENCGAELEDNDSKDKCPSCGGVVSEAMKFCPICGERLKKN